MKSTAKVLSRQSRVKESFRVWMNLDICTFTIVTRLKWSFLYCLSWCDVHIRLYIDLPLYHLHSAYVSFSRTDMETFKNNTLHISFGNSCGAWPRSALARHPPACRAWIFDFGGGGGGDVTNILKRRAPLCADAFSLLEWLWLQSR